MLSLVLCNVSFSQYRARPAQPPQHLYSRYKSLINILAIYHSAASIMKTNLFPGYSDTHRLLSITKKDKNDIVRICDTQAGTGNTELNLWNRLMLGAHIYFFTFFLILWKEYLLLITILYMLFIFNSILLEKKQQKTFFFFIHAIENYFFWWWINGVNTEKNVRLLGIAQKKILLIIQSMSFTFFMYIIYL